MIRLRLSRLLSQNPLPFRRKRPNISSKETIAVRKVEMALVAVEGDKVEGGKVEGAALGLLGTSSRTLTPIP
jgi:hypothetical protein